MLPVANYKSPLQKNQTLFWHYSKLALAGSYKYSYYRPDNLLMSCAWCHLPEREITEFRELLCCNIQGRLCTECVLVPNKFWKILTYVLLQQAKLFLAAENRLFRWRTLNFLKSGSSSSQFKLTMLDIYKQVELEHDEQLRLYKERLKFAETWKSFSPNVFYINTLLEVHKVGSIITISATE